ncbi:MAG: ATP-binding protein [Flammeovirgaceae bacterium]
MDDFLEETSFLREKSSQNIKQQLSIFDSKFKYISERLYEIIFLIDVEGKIVFVNASFEKITGHKIQTLLKQTVENWIFTPEMQRLGVEKIQQQAFSIEKMEVCMLNSLSKPMYFEMQVMNWESKKNHYILILHDITRWKESERKLHQANHELDRFVYRTSHDLRGPITSILGIINLLEENISINKKEMIEMIKSSAMRLDHIIKEIAFFSETELKEVRKEKFSFIDLYNSTVKRLEKNLTEFSKFRAEVIILNDGELYADKLRLQLILYHLIANAFFFQNYRCKEPFVKITLKNVGNMIELTVEDNGIGMSSSVQKKAFEMFYRGSEQSGGAGLGLYLVNKAVEHLNGEIYLSSEEGKGTTFKIYIPNF